MTTTGTVSPAAPPKRTPLLEISGLVVELLDGTRLIDGIDLSIDAGETLALVGESGAGKSLTALAIMRLLAPDLMRIGGGSIKVRGEDILALSENRFRRMRGSELAMIFQDPLTALNPVLTVGKQLTEALLLHRNLSARAAGARAAELLDMVGIPDPRARLKEYPHRLSGGMRQRVMIAMALAGEPDFLVADEPTTALDITISAQILELLAQLQQDLGLGMLLITHDLHVVRDLAHRVAIMYSGRVVESGEVSAVFGAPGHPYTEGLMHARPHGSLLADGHRLQEIPGTVPAPSARPQGCAFGPRCTRRQADCAEAIPEIRTLGPGGARSVACFHARTKGPTC